MTAFARIVARFCVMMSLLVVVDRLRVNCSVDQHRRHRKHALLHHHCNADDFAGKVLSEHVLLRCVADIRNDVDHRHRHHRERSGCRYPVLCVDRRMHLERLVMCDIAPRTGDSGAVMSVLNVHHHHHLRDDHQSACLARNCGCEERGK